MRFDTRACFSPRAVFDLRLYVGPGRMTRSRTRSGHEKRKMQDQRWPACCSHEKHGFFVCSDRHPPRPVLYLGAKPGLTTGALSRASSSGILRLIDCWTVAPPGLSPCLHSSGLIIFLDTIQLSGRIFSTRRIQRLEEHGEHRPSRG